jgi:hypothetical protein
MTLLAVLGINGSMEAFVMARADVVKTIPKFKYFSLLSTAIFVSTSLLLLHLGFGYFCWNVGLLDCSWATQWACSPASSSAGIYKLKNTSN